MFTENKTTELKREYVDDIKNTAIAFANCDGGTIYVGIEDDGTVRGVDDADGTMLRVTNAIRDAMHGDLVSGVARAVDAILRAVLLAAGAGVALTLMMMLEAVKW